jgi:hypothetical protein
MLKQNFTILTAAAVLFLGGLCDAAVITANNPSFSAVSTAVAQASPGDTVMVAAGIAVWTNSLLIGKNIQLIGAGIGQTIIVDEEPRSGRSDNVIFWITTSNGVARLSGFTFAGGTTNVSIAFDGAINVSGTCGAFRLDHCKFNNLFNANVFVSQAVFGVVDHCQFYETNWANGIEVENGQIGGDQAGYGDVSWATPVQWGQTNDFFYIEDCIFSCPTRGPGVDDFCRGTRLAFRYNVVTNYFFQNHGTESSQRFRSGRAAEIYGNIFVNTSNPLEDPLINLRGGTGVVFSNNVVGFRNLFKLQNFRSTARYHPWGSANGQNSWDSNNPSLLATGTVTGAPVGVYGDIHLQDMNANWTVNQWVGGYELQNVSLGGTNPVTFSLIYSNSAHDIYYLSDPGGNYIHWTNGQTYAIYQSYAQLDQVGRGQGDLVADTSPGNGVPVNTVTGQPTWPNEASEPLYQWGNTFNGTPNYAVGPDGDTGSYNVIKYGRDYFDNTVKPGYTPLVYPHPLVSSLGTVPGTGGGTTTGTGTVGPPADLQAHPPTPH